ncbi:hypothetical protein C2G38_875021 [Gigaspora rosea]|uniref:Uncharacterized protein n=1 Tax=Gigaspora rosea TaxID=44941 RepID=A0A397VWC7_9GLOM|nr:hypothetical protein C2G38_875021 [Gigaspora rosea]
MKYLRRWYLHGNSVIGIINTVERDLDFILELLYVVICRVYWVFYSLLLVLLC